MWKVTLFMIITHILSKLDYLYNIIQYINLCLLFYVNDNLFSFTFQNSEKYQSSNKNITFHKVLIDKIDKTGNWNLLTYYKWDKEYNGMNLYDIKYFYPNTNIILLVYLKRPGLISCTSQSFTTGLAHCDVTLIRPCRCSNYSTMSVLAFRTMTFFFSLERSLMRTLVGTGLVFSRAL